LLDCRSACTLEKAVDATLLEPLQPLVFTALRFELAFSFLLFEFGFPFNTPLTGGEGFSRDERSRFLA
jgi:hypothetical protein